MSRENKKYLYLLKNTMVFGLGTFGSKVLQFLIVPLYTYVLTTEEYGKIDIFATTISLVLPFITLLIQESIIRFLTVNEIDTEDAINTGMIVFLNSIILSIVFTPIYAVLFETEYASIFFICLVLNSFVAIFQNYLKACGKIIDFTVCGLINTGVFLATNVLLIIVFKMGIIGYLYSMIVSQLVSAIFIIIRGRVIAKISLSKRHLKILREMLRFSIPLIPNNLMWWIMNAGDKYIINFYMGDGANGLYSLSIKLATIVTTMFSVFMQAWQLSAIEEHGKDEQAEFYSKVHSNMMMLLLITSLAILIFNRSVFRLMIGRQFFDAHLYSPLLCVATVINCMSTFYGVIYVVSKKTSKAFTTTVIGAITNVAANLILIKPFGLTGVAIGTIVGYVVMTIIRMKDALRYVAIDLDILKTSIGLGIAFVSSIMYIYLSDNAVILIGCIAMLIVILLYIKNVKSICSNIVGKERHKL